MAKKSKEEPVPTINNVVNRDILQRLNFMYQASAYLQSLQGLPVEESSASRLLHEVAEPSQRASGAGEARRKKRKLGAGQKRKTAGDLAQVYSRTMKVVAKKTTVKMCALQLLPLAHTDALTFDSLDLQGPLNQTSDLQRM